MFVLCSFPGSNFDDGIPVIWTADNNNGWDGWQAAAHTWKASTASSTTIATSLAFLAFCLLCIGHVASMKGGICLAKIQADRCPLPSLCLASKWFYHTLLLPPFSSLSVSGWSGHVRTLDLSLAASRLGLRPCQTVAQNSKCWDLERWPAFQEKSIQSRQRFAYRPL